MSYFRSLARRLTLFPIPFCPPRDNWFLRLRSPIPFIEALSIGERFGVPICLAPFYILYLSYHYPTLIRGSQ